MQAIYKLLYAILAIPARERERGGEERERERRGGGERREGRERGGGGCSCWVTIQEDMYLCFPVAY